MRFRRKFEPQAAVNLVPMVDVVFQLVLFFLVSTTLALVPGIRLKLPASGTTERVPIRQLVVTVASATELWLNNEPVASASELNARLAAMSEDDRTALESVIIEADQQVPYGLMVEVLDALRRNGLKDVGLRTRGRAAQ
jgi:biopolymer transport protein ExbD